MISRPYICINNRNYMEEKFKKFIKFCKENKTTICLGAITIVSVSFAIRAYRKLDRENSEILKLVDNRSREYDIKWKDQLETASDYYSKVSSILNKRFNKLEDAEALIWPVRGVDPVSSVTEIPGLSGWGGALRGSGIFTVGDLIRFVRENDGPDDIIDFPGIGQIGYESIVNFLSKHTTPEFKSIYL